MNRNFGKSCGAMVAVALAIANGSAWAGSSPSNTIEVQNRRGVWIEAMVFDNNDAQMSVPASSARLEPNGSVKLKCNTNGSCKVRVYLSDRMGTTSAVEWSGCLEVDNHDPAPLGRC